MKTNQITKHLNRYLNLKMSVFNLTLVFLISLIITQIATAEPVQKYLQCYTDTETGEIRGKNTDKPEVIASVSKAFTSLWAAHTFGLKYRFPTKVFIQPVGNNKYDVHLKGSVFPYFDRTMLYFLFSELNKRKINDIAHLTFDENFEYGSIIRNKRKLAHQGKTQTDEDIIKELKRDIYNIKNNYSEFIKQANTVLSSKKLKKQIDKSIDVHVDDIAPLSLHIAEGLYKKSKSKDLSFTIKSVELHRILKEMNRNSNNFAADKIFERLTRTHSFNDFMKSIKISDKEYEIYNGSGYPVSANDTKYYNKASCKAVIKVMQELNKVAEKSKLGIKNILPVANMDASEDGLSTVTKNYSTQYSNGALIAKTGTVNNWISLGGALLTQKGLVYFHMAIAYDGTKSSLRHSQEKIKSFIKKNVDRNDGKDILSSYKPKPFFPFDEGSI